MSHLVDVAGGLVALVAFFVLLVKLAGSAPPDDIDTTEVSPACRYRLSGGR